MPLIYQTETVSDRGNHVIIKKTTEKDKHDKPKLYAINKTPLPHQEDFVNHFESSKFISPTCMMFAMGSGKGHTSLLCAMKLFELGVTKPKVIVLCDLSILGQWASAVRSLHTPPGMCFDIMGYNHFEKALNEDDFESNCRRADLIVVDEFQIFRNLSDRMRAMVDAIRKCSRVLLLSGTPIVNSQEDEVGFKYICTGRTDISLAAACNGRVAYYDPALLAHSKGRYPTIVREIIPVSMSWAQTLMYFGQRSNNFKLPLPGNEGILQVQRVVQNRYSMAIQSMANMPFPNNPEKSPKVMALVNNVIKISPHGRQVIYSSRIEKGVDSILAMLKTSKLKIVKIDGGVAAGERCKIVKAYNSGNVDVLILSPASARGVDLMGTYAFHLFEPHQNISEESQTLTRAVRYDSHKGMEDPKVRVFQYITVFPTEKAVQSDTDLMMVEAANIFGPNQVEDVSVMTMLGALKMEINAERETVDEIQSKRNTKKHIEVQKCIDIIKRASIPMPLTEAAGKPKPVKEELTTSSKVRKSIDDYETFAEGGWHQGQFALSAVKSKKLITGAVRDVVDKEGVMLNQDFRDLVTKRATKLFVKGDYNNNTPKAKRVATPKTKTYKAKTPRSKTPRAKTPKTPKAKTPRQRKK